MNEISDLMKDLGDLLPLPFLIFNFLKNYKLL